MDSKKFAWPQSVSSTIPHKPSFIMGPHPKHFYDPGFFKDLIYQTVLNIDTAGIRASEVADQFFIRWRSPEEIGGQNFENRFRLRPQARRGEPFRVLLRLLGVDNLP